jgi:hypothetical protein
MKEIYLDGVTIVGELPTTIPDTHLLVCDEAWEGDGTCKSYFLVPKELWEEFETIREKLEQEAELVYEEEEDYSPSTSVFTACRYYNE